MSCMKQMACPGGFDRSAGSKGGRSRSTLSTGQAPPAPPATPPSVPALRVGPLAPGRRAQARGGPAPAAGRERGAPLTRTRRCHLKLEQWSQKADAALDGALKEREAETASADLAAAMHRIGELSMENELLRARLGALPQADLSLWSGGGCADGQGRLPRQRPALRHPARPPVLGRAPLQHLSRPGAGAGQRHPGQP
jgi:transposase